MTTRGCVRPHPLRPRRAIGSGRLLPVLALVCLALVAAACAKNAPQSTLDPAGPPARTIDNLIMPVFMVAGVIFVLVEGLVLVFCIRYRQRRHRQEEPVQIEGNTRLELFWTLVPALILAVIAVPTLVTIFKLARKPANALAVTVVGHQWWWEYRYDEYGITTANELHIPAGRPVFISLKSDDVIHSFWVPRLAGKIDVVPTRTNHMTIEADEPGTYLGQCVEFCGLSHANMRNRAIAHTPQGFMDWINSQRPPPPPPPEGSPAAEGQALFTSKGCGGCHTVQGVSKGTAGPDLTHVYSRTTFAGSTFAMNPANLRSWLADPPKEKPGSLMPDLDLSQEEITQLIAYLQTLK